MASTSDNHAKAPHSAEFVKAMREVFGGEVKVLYVEEGAVKLGEPVPGPFATCFIVVCPT